MTGIGGGDPRGPAEASGGSRTELPSVLADSFLDHRVGVGVRWGGGEVGVAGEEWKGPLP